MAVTAIKGNAYRMTANGDALNQVTVGHRHVAGAFRTRVSAIHMVAGATGGQTTLTAEGGSGPVIVTANVPANDTLPFTFSEPVDIADLTITALGTNVTVIVFTE